MKYAIRFKIGNRFDSVSKYSLREFCIFIVERFSLTERECQSVIELKIGESICLKDFYIYRIK